MLKRIHAICMLRSHCVQQFYEAACIVEPYGITGLTNSLTVGWFFTISVLFKSFTAFGIHSVKTWTALSVGKRIETLKQYSIQCINVFILKLETTRGLKSMFALPKPKDRALLLYHCVTKQFQVFLLLAGYWEQSCGYKCLPKVCRATAILGVVYYQWIMVNVPCT